MKKSTNAVDETKVDKILVDMKNTDWDKIVPQVNEKQKTVKYATVFDKSEQLKSTDVRSHPTIATVNVRSLPAAVTENVSDSPTVNEIDQIDVIDATQRYSVRKRRNAIFRPSAAVSHFDFISV